MTDTSCPEGEVLSAYVDREANPSEERRVDLHLADCGACRARVRSLARLKSAVRSQPLPPLPPDVRDALDRLTREAGSGPGSRPWRWVPALPAAMGSRPAWGVAFAVVALALFWTGWRLRSPLPGVPVDLILAAHNQYARTMPLASTEKIMSELPVQISYGGDAEVRDVY